MWYRDLTKNSNKLNMTYQWMNINKRCKKMKEINF